MVRQPLGGDSLDVVHVLGGELVKPLVGAGIIQMVLVQERVGVPLLVVGPTDIGDSAALALEREVCRDPRAGFTGDFKTEKIAGGEDSACQVANGGFVA